MPASPSLLTKTPGMSLKAVDSIAKPACPMLYIDVSRTILTPVLLLDTCVLAPVSHINTFSWCNIANASPSFATGASSPSFPGINDVTKTSTFEDAALDLAAFSLYQVGAFARNFFLYDLSGHRICVSC